MVRLHAVVSGLKYYTCSTIKYDNCDLMHFPYDHYNITPPLTLAQVQAQNNSCPCSALH